MSDRKLNSLSDQTLKVLEHQVREEVEFIIFSSQNNRKRIVKFLELFKNYNQKIKIEYYDPILRPDLTQKYGVVQAPSIVIKGKKDKYIVVTDLRELAVTNGLIRLFREKDPILCFIKDDIFTKTGETGYSNFFNLLNQSSFIVRQVDLLKEIEVPKRCNALLSWAMSRDLLGDEIKKIKDYYESGGIVVGTFSPMFKDDTIRIFDVLKEGKTTKDYPIALSSIFNLDVQPFIRNWMKYNPQTEIAKLEIPILIINGTKDLQVSEAEAKLLHEAAKSSTLKIIENMNHVLVTIEGDDLENSKSYNESGRKLAEGLLNELTQFIK